MTEQPAVVARDQRTARVLLRAVDCESVSTLRFDPHTLAGVLTTWAGPTAPRERALTVEGALAARLTGAARRRVAVPMPWPRPPGGATGRDDLAIPLRGPDGLVTWLLTRLGRAFQAQDVDHATLLVPGLLGRLDRPVPIRGRSAVARTSGPLTGRELEVLRLVGHGLTAAAVGRRLAISERTVRKHLEHVYGKLDCTDRLSAVLAARARGLL